MKSLALLLLLPCCAFSLTPKDESDIRAAIEEQAKKDNQKGELWSERGPLTYQVRTIEPVTADVATAEADGVRTGTFSEHLQYLFILTRSHGNWSVARRIQVCKPLRFLPISESPRSGVHGSSDYPN
jgi:hypothetical protein